MFFVFLSHCYVETQEHPDIYLYFLCFVLIGVCSTNTSYLWITGTDTKHDKDTNVNTNFNLKNKVVEGHDKDTSSTGTVGVIYLQIEDECVWVSCSIYMSVIHRVW